MDFAPNTQKNPKISGATEDQSSPPPNSSMASNNNATSESACPRTRELNSQSSAMEPAAAEGLIMGGEDIDNPSLNDKFMDTLRNSAKERRPASSQNDLLSDGDSAIADVDGSVDLGIIRGSKLERASKVPSLTMPVLKVIPPNLNNNNKGGTTAARLGTSDFRSMPLRNQNNGHVRVGPGSVPVAGVAHLRPSNSSGSFSRIRGGRGHRKTHSHSDNVDLANALFPAAAIMAAAAARATAATGSNHYLDDISALKNGMSLKGSGAVRAIHDDKTLADVGRIVVDDISRDEDLFTASPATLASRRELAVGSASTAPISNSTSNHINKRDLAGDDWMRSREAEQLRHYIENPTTLGDPSKAAGGATPRNRGRSTESGGSQTLSRATPSSDTIPNDFLVEDGTLPLINVLHAIARASSSGGGLSRNVSVDTAYVLDNTNTLVEKHQLKLQTPSAIAAPNVDDQAAAILAEPSEENGPDSGRRRQQRQAELTVDASARNANKVPMCSQRKRVDLTNYNMKREDVPVNAICSKPLGKDLHKMILAGNKLMTVPDRFVLELTSLRTLDLQQCDLVCLPPIWNLKSLRRLILSHNKLDEFLGEDALSGLPELRYLDMYDNKLCELVLPKKGNFLGKLEFLNLGFNDLTCLPDEFTHLRKLRVFKVPNNLITHISKDVVHMDLKELEVTPNPLIQPPLGDCERGLCGMRRYYKCLASRSGGKGSSGATSGIAHSVPSPCSLETAVSELVFSPSKGRRQLKKFLMDNPIEKVKKVVPAIFSRGMHLPKKDHPARSCSAPVAHIDVDSNVKAATDGADSRRPRANYSMSRLQRHLSTSTSVSSDDGHSVKSDEKGLSERTSETIDEDQVSLQPSPRRRLMAISEPSKQDSVPSGLSEIGPNPLAKAMDGKAKSFSSLIASSSVIKTREISLDRPNELSVKVNDMPQVKVAAQTKNDSIIDTRKRDPELLNSRSQSMPPSIEIGSEDVDVDYIWSTEEERISEPADVAVNDTLKIIFVGMAYTGKTSLIRRLIDGHTTIIPKRDERTIGVDIFEWNPSKHDAHIEDCSARLNTKVKREEDVAGSPASDKDVNVKFSVWDFAGQNVYHATHELFFSPRALYVLAWDMGINNKDTRRRRMSLDDDHDGPFSLSDSEDEDNGLSEHEVRRAERALERDIDEKVQFWVDCIQSSVPGAVILPVATFDDAFGAEEGGPGEARRRCQVMKKRLLQHEARRRDGLDKRLAQIYKNKEANTETASRLRKLLCPMARPKLIFGIDKHDSVLRVSSTKYTGFCALRSKIVNISTGRDLGGTKYPMFRGHVGAIIPQMRLEVRDVVRCKRKGLPVTEWGHLLSILRESMREEVICNHDDVSDALEFLSNIGELSYFGKSSDQPPMCHTESPEEGNSDDEDEEDEDVSTDKVLAIDDISSDPYLTLMDDGDDTAMKSSFMSNKAPTPNITGTDSCNLSDYVFLNPRWLVAVVACILRHDLRQAIDDTRRRLAENVDYQDDGLEWQQRGGFHSTYLNCPIITAEEATMLWKTKRKILKAAERSKNVSSNSASMTTFDFLQKLLIRFNVLVPIDLNVEKAQFGGEEYGIEDQANAQDGETVGPLVTPPLEQPCFFFLPSLLGPGTPSEQVWTYKCSEAFKTTLCVSWWFPDGCPPGLMERVNASVLRDIYATTQHGKESPQTDWRDHQVGDMVGKLRVHEVLCWRSAFLLQLGMKNVINRKGDVRESMVEIFAHLVDQDDPMCVAADSMTIGTRRLVVSAKGQQGDGARKMWKGGYEMVTKALERVVREYGGLEFEKEGVCPECLQNLSVKEASVWNWTHVIDAAKNGRSKMRCKRAHLIDTHLIGGFRVPALQSIIDIPPNMEAEVEGQREMSTSIVPVKDLIGAVVLVALWDGKQKKILRVGSGFVVDNKRGLIVTASHTLIRMEGDGAFGENYYGIKNAKALIGLIPQNAGNNNDDPEGQQKKSTAVFKYFAEIVSDDVDNMDACVLKIKTKLEKDIEENCEIAAVHEIPLLDKKDIKREKIPKLPVTTQCEVEEEVRVLGFNQGGEGLFNPGSTLNRVVDFAKGYIVRSFRVNESTREGRRTFIPRHELVVNAPTIGGHSGGPCVNKLGEVIGILSRADPADKGRCYLVPTSEFMSLVNESKTPKNFNDLF